MVKDETAVYVFLQILHIVHILDIMHIVHIVHILQFNVTLRYVTSWISLILWIFSKIKRKRL